MKRKIESIFGNERNTLYCSTSKIKITSHEIFSFDNVKGYECILIKK